MRIVSPLCLLAMVSLFVIPSFAEKRKVSYTVEAQSPDLLKVKLKETIGQIQNRQIVSFKHGDCFPMGPADFEMENVELSSKFRIGNDNDLIPYFVGQINYTVNGCPQQN